MNRKSRPMQVRSFDYDVKAVSEAGIFTGYGSVFGVVDSYNEVVAPGAFLESLAEAKAKGRSFPVLWQHNTGEPIGSWDTEALKEDEHGLIGAGELWLDDAPYARIAYRGMKARAITGLSIGYYVRESSRDEKTGIRTLTKLDLVEISIVTVPANDEARTDVIKSKLAHGGLPSLREFEALLREQGFSKNQSAIIANRGLQHLLRSDPEGDQAETQIAKALHEQLSQGLTLPTF